MKQLVLGIDGEQTGVPEWMTLQMREKLVTLMADGLLAVVGAGPEAEPEGLGGNGNVR